MNFTTEFFRHVQEEPERAALIYEDREISYGELGRRIHRFGNGLKHLGVKPGDRVALLMNNRPEFVIPYYATLKIGAVIVPLNTFLVVEELEYQLENMEASILICTDWRAPDIVSMRDQMPGVEHLITVGVFDGAVDFEAFLEGEAEDLDLNDVDDTDVALIRYTSGTTGRPKGAMQTHGNITRFLRVNMDVYAMKPEDRPLLFVPLFHGFGDHCCMNFAFLAGASFVLMDPFRPDQILRAVERHRCNYFGAPPSMLYGLMHHPDADKYDVSSLKRVLTGGGPVSREIIDGFEEKFGTPVLQGYGLSEGTAGYTYTRIGMPFKEGSCGIPLPGVEIRIVDDQGREVPTGADGEVVVRSDFNMKGYWKDPQATEETLVNGWLHTGDIGRLDAEGYLSIVDRKKEMIIMSGENIYPSEVEDVLLTHPSIMEAAVIGAPDPRRGEIPVAVIAPKPGTDPEEEEIITFCRERMASFKVPRKVFFRDSLPKGSTFKVLRRKVKEELYGGSR